MYWSSVAKLKGGDFMVSAKEISRVFGYWVDGVCNLSTGSRKNFFEMFGNLLLVSYNVSINFYLFYLFSLFAANWDLFYEFPDFFWIFSVFVNVFMVVKFFACSKCWVIYVSKVLYLTESAMDLLLMDICSSLFFWMRDISKPFVMKRLILWKFLLNFCDLRGKWSSYRVLNISQKML